MYGYLFRLVAGFARFDFVFLLRGVGAFFGSDTTAGASTESSGVATFCVEEAKNPVRAVTF